MPGTGEPAARSPRWPARSGGLAAPVAEVALVHARPNHLLAQVSRLGGGSAAGIPTAAAPLLDSLLGRIAALEVRVAKLEKPDLSAVPLHELPAAVFTKR